MTVHPVMGFEPFESTTKLPTALGPGRPFMLRGCGLATDQKAVRRRGPGRVVLGSKPQLATAKKLVSWAIRVTGRTTSSYRVTANRSVLLARGRRACGSRIAPRSRGG